MGGARTISDTLLVFAIVLLLVPGGIPAVNGRQSPWRVEVDLDAHSALGGASSSPPLSPRTPIFLYGNLVDLVVDPVRLDAGVIRLPDTPGLGATVDPAALKRYRVDL